MSHWVMPQIDGRAIALLGASPLGRRIALSWILHGFDVVLYEPDASLRNTTTAFVDHKIRDCGSRGSFEFFTNI